MKLNRKWILVIALVMSLATAISGTLAYLQDTATARNTFTVGNVEIDLIEEGWDQNEEHILLPGAEFAKKPYIQNKGNEAWVWMEIELPTALYTSKDVIIDWNDDYWDRTSVSDAATGITTVTLKQKKPTPLAENGTTEEAFSTISIPYDVTSLSDLGSGDIDIDVTAYAVQSDNTINTLDKAIRASKGEKIEGEGGEGGEPGTPSGTAVATANELTEALANGVSVYLTQNINMDGYKVDIAENTTATIDLNGYTLTSMDGGSNKGNMAILVNRGADLTLKDSVGTGKLVASCYGVYVQPNATFTMDGGTIDVSGNNKYDFGVTVWNGKFIMNRGTINANYGVCTSNYWRDQNGEGVTCEVIINDGCVLNSISSDIDITDAPDTNCDVPANVNVVKPEDDSASNN